MIIFVTVENMQENVFQIKFIPIRFARYLNTNLFISQRQTNNTHSPPPHFVLNDTAAFIFFDLMAFDTNKNVAR